MMIWTRDQQELTTGCVDGVAQLGVLPFAQLELLGIGSSFGGLNLWTSGQQTGSGDRKSAIAEGHQNLWEIKVHLRSGVHTGSQECKCFQLNQF